jgi:hypothetical protein
MGVNFHGGFAFSYVFFQEVASVDKASLNNVRNGHLEQFEALHLGFHMEMMIPEKLTHFTCVLLPTQLLNSLLEASVTQIISS